METVRGLNALQIQQLLTKINPKRVMKSQGHAHVTQQDIVAHLIRVFGFGNFDIEVKSVEHIFTNEYTNPKTGELTGGFNVCYKALVRLTIRDIHGNNIAYYENGSTGYAANQSLGDGHDLAYKSSISLSVKRCAINLGDQFGLSLYNKGQLEALVINSIPYMTESKDIQADVKQQVSLGNDETEREDTVESSVSKVVVDEVVAVVTAEQISRLQGIYAHIWDIDSLKALRDNANLNSDFLDTPFSNEAGEQTTLRALYIVRKAQIVGEPQK